MHSQWVASVLRELTNQHLAELTLPDKWLFDSKPRLLNPTVPTARMLAALKKLFPGRRNLRFFIASGANVNGHECCWKSDVVRGKIGDQASPRVEIFTGQVGYHFSVHCSATDDHAIFTSIGGVLKMQCRDLFQVLRFSLHQFGHRPMTLLSCLTQFMYRNDELAKTEESHFECVSAAPNMSLHVFACSPKRAL